MEDRITHFVFDTETLGVEPDAVVLAVAIVPFYFERLDPFEILLRNGRHWKLKIASQIERGRKIENETFQWWQKQDEDVRKILLPDPKDTPPNIALKEMGEFLLQCGYSKKQSYLWSRGNLFDFGKIESLYRTYKIPVPWNSFMQRDIRTYVDIMTGTYTGRCDPINSRKGFRMHNCLHDAADDALTLVEQYQKALVENDDIPY